MLRVTLILILLCTRSLAEEPHVRVRLICDKAIATSGSTVTIGVTFDIDKDWHLYWPGLNDTGYAPKIVMTLPDGCRLGPWQWPAPKRHVSPGDILDHVYEKQVTAVASLEIPKDVGRQVHLRARIDWLVCSDVCLMEKGSTELSIPIGETAHSGHRQKLFDMTAARLARPLPKGEVRLEWEGSTLRIQAMNAKELTFFPGELSALPTDLVRTGQRKGDRLDIEFDRDAKRPRVIGILEVESGSDQRIYRINLPVP